MAFVNPPAWTPVVSQSKFFQPGLIETTPPAQAAVVLNMGWYEPWPDPAYQASQPITESVTWVPPAPVIRMGWYESFSVPAPISYRNEIGAASLWVPTAPTIRMGWYEPWQNAPLPTPSVFSPSTQWTPFVPSTATQTPAQMGWYEPWTILAATVAPQNYGLAIWTPFVPAVVISTQNYVATGAHNYISQEIGEGVKF